MAIDMLTGDPAEEALKKEFEFVVQNLVESVRQTASETVEQASAGMKQAAEDLRSTSGAVEQTAREARGSLATVRDNTRAVEVLKEELQGLRPQLGSILGELNGVQLKTATLQRAIDAVGNAVARLEGALGKQVQDSEARVRATAWAAAVTVLLINSAGLLAMVLVLLLRR